MTNGSQTLALPRSSTWLGRANAWFMDFLDDYGHRKLGARKTALFAGLPSTVLELGPGAGANLRYYAPGTELVAVEPSPDMRARLLRNAARRGVRVRFAGLVGESIDLPDASFDAVVGTLVLCSVADPARVLAEVRRVLRPGGRYLGIEHVAAEGGLLAALQRAVARPWACAFEGCDVHRDTAAVVRRAGFASTSIERFTLATAFLPIRPQVMIVTREPGGAE